MRFIIERNYGDKHNPGWRETDWVGWDGGKEPSNHKEVREAAQNIPESERSKYRIFREEVRRTQLAASQLWH